MDVVDFKSKSLHYYITSIPLMWTVSYGFPQGAAIVAGKATKNAARAKELQEEGGMTAHTENHKH